jgi:hypothetical protein
MAFAVCDLKRELQTENTDLGIMNYNEYLDGAADM